MPLDVKGMFSTNIVTKRGAKKTTVVYVVAGYHPESLLGDSDAVDWSLLRSGVRVDIPHNRRWKRMRRRGGRRGPDKSGGYQWGPGRPQAFLRK